MRAYGQRGDMVAVLGPIRIIMFCPMAVNRLLASREIGVLLGKAVHESAWADLERPTERALYHFARAACDLMDYIYTIAMKWLSACTAPLVQLRFLWPLYGIGQAIIFLPCVFYLSSFFFILSSSTVSGRKLDVYHTSTHSVALVQI